ncbi:cryptochrome/photolyase family protein [Bavariicoccus seileri]|uniref:cryptochrome/photolyase family protein n=1 Tax=Bavariicoccus seileri TaxID=549685 RepID=UPI003F936DF2
MTSIMWFRRDLRLEDNTALNHLLKNHHDNPIIFLFHINPSQLTDNFGFNQHTFFSAVKHFKHQLVEKGIELLILQGELEKTFKSLKEQYPEWDNIYFNEDETGFGAKRDREALAIFTNLGVTAHHFSDHYLIDASSIVKDNGSYYKVFTPYFKKWEAFEKRKPNIIQFKSSNIRLRPSIQATGEDNMGNLTDLLLPQEKLTKEIAQLNFGTVSAKKALHDFITNHLSNYDKKRDFPAQSGTSKLSRFLRTGELSIRTVFEAALPAKDSSGKESFIKELAWRDFYNMIYATHPNQQKEPIIPYFSHIHWVNDESQFERWKDGLTGYPIIDAAMRQLKTTGWMHNRLRMITASFLTKDLLIDWRLGESYFKKQLIDYDPASNIGGWQWAASTGTDAVPYFRIFNPITQSKKFDPSGTFIKQYVPELKTLSEKEIHFPSILDMQIKQKRHVIVGKDYPEPIIDHQWARKRAVAAYEESKDRF